LLTGEGGRIFQHTQVWFAMDQQGFRRGSYARLVAA